MKGGARYAGHAASAEDALRDFNYEVAMGRIDHVNDKKRVTVSECY